MYKITSYMMKTFNFYLNKRTKLKKEQFFLKKEEVIIKSIVDFFAFLSIFLSFSCTLLLNNFAFAELKPTVSSIQGKNDLENSATITSSASTKTSSTSASVATKKASVTTSIIAPSVIGNIENNNDYTAISIGWSEQVGAAVFVKAGKLWIIFDAPSSILFQGATEKQLENGKLKGFKQINIDSKPQATFILADVSPSIKMNDISVIRSENTWLIKAIDRQGSNSTQRIDADDKGIVTHISPADGMIEINFNNKSGKIISYTDPFVGNEMSVIPTTMDSIYVDDTYYYIDFRLLKTSQGVAIQKDNDQVDIQTEYGNILIKGKNEPLTLSQKIYSDKGHDVFQKLSQFDTKKSILSLVGYKTHIASFQDELYKLNRLAHDSKSLNKGIIWLNISLFLAANQWYSEAATAIRLAYSYNTALINDYKAMLLEAIAEFMNGKHERANEIIRNISIDNVDLADKEEIRFWNGIIALKMNEDKVDNNLDVYFAEMKPENIVRIMTAKHNSFISDYTDDIIFECASTTFYKLMEENSLHTKSILNLMSKLNITSRNNNRLLYYFAKYYISQEEPDKALEYFNNCLENVEDQFNYVRCSVEKSKYLTDLKLVPMDDYHDKLERANLLWRGDAMEIKNLTTLANLYHQSSQYAKSLRILKIISTNYPNNAASINAVNKMGSIFIEFFTNYDKQKISPLQALSFFYEFQDIIPIGNTGDDIVLRAAGYMIELYMLDRASALLEHQVTNRLIGQRQEITLNILARVYIANNKADMAVKILENRGELNKVTTDPIQEQRKYIYAKALLHNKNYSKMLEFLQNDYSYKADNLKTKAYWELNIWRSFNDFSEPYLYSIRYNDSVISPSDSLKELKQIISYTQTNDKELANEIYLDFKDRMPTNYIYSDIIKQMNKLYKIPAKYDIKGMEDLKQIKEVIESIVVGKS